MIRTLMISNFLLAVANLVAYCLVGEVFNLFMMSANLGVAFLLLSADK